MVHVETESVPSDKRYHMSTRENSSYKWQTHGVIGAFEVETEPALDVEAPLSPLDTNDSSHSQRWKQAQALWNQKNLSKSFIEAAKSVPVETCCCGLIRDDVETLNKLIPILNDTWCPKVNQEQLADSNFKVDCFLWSWSNISGQSETRELLVRFHDTTTDKNDE